FAEVLVDVQPHDGARERAHEVVTAGGAARPSGAPRHEPQAGELARDVLARRLARSHEHERRAPADAAVHGTVVRGVAPKREVVGARAGAAVALDARAVV